ncbi:MAG TPA: exodeoxyribonuclease VII large subunit [Flavobacteriales bacterium]|nr:exodeoxyribonuclease VII large subunit [Flavobacteriales bacterium]
MSKETIRSYSLSKLASSIQTVLAKSYTHSYWVKAEIHKLNYYPHSGHCYPELIEKKDNKVVAQFRSTLWADTFLRLSGKFKHYTGEEISDNMSVLIQVRVNYQPVYGISLNIIDIDPSFSLGSLEKEKQETIEHLMRKGLFQKNKSLSLPDLPNRAAIISVSTSKGYHDFLSVINEKLAYFNFSHELFPALLQGERAMQSISEQLKIISSRSSDFDLVYIIRGGGGETGLHSYNKLELAEQVAHCPIPVVTGIGHATNETVVEMISKVNRITPTEVANFTVDLFLSAERRFENIQDHIEHLVLNQVREESNRLNQLHQVIMRQVQWHQKSSLLKLEQHSRDIQQMMQWKLSEKHQTLSFLEKLIGKKSFYLLDYQKNKVLSLSNILADKFDEKGKKELEKLNTLSRFIQAVDPQTVLKRGFSITRHKGDIVTDKAKVKTGDIIETQLSKGMIKSNIK